MDVHVRELRYFVAVAEELHFTRAAELLHISQPSLSKQIRLLERDLGFALFRRDRRTVALTDAGEALLPRARELVGSWNEALAEATQRARAAAALLRVGFQTSVAGALYQFAVTRFRKDHSGWGVELKLHPWSDPTAGLLDDTSDVAFLWLPVPGQERLAWQTLRTEPRHVALCSAHPLAQRAELQMSDLLDEPFVALPPAAGVLRDYWLAVDERNGHPVRIGAQAETPDETFEAVAAKQGVALLSAGNARLYSRPQITTRPVIDLSPAELALAWRSDDERPIIREFGDAAQEAVTACPVPDTTAAGAKKHEQEDPGA
jgi:DNA-binding transcriptional LysR family regulator